jgi:lipopolysaccharide transport system ATP-binding protein
MSYPIIRVENLSKRYTLLHQQDRHATFRDALTHRVKSLKSSFTKTAIAPLAQTSEDFWALKDVSFDIQAGDRVGIIGRNGAGKSTLLKILSRITAPTNGEIRIQGRVASLLEVGTGFHPELSGCENIFLNGAILGMSKAEISRKFDEIVEFAEISRFIDTPVKRYSSGMYVRLAFAVAAHLEPEILIVDEVLAVGDAQFQKKCLGKMEDVANAGRTVLFVSHNIQAISTLTTSAIFLVQGQLVKQGPTEQVINEYLRYGANAHDLVYRDQPSDSVPNITSVKLVTSEPANSHLHGKPLELELEISTPRAIQGGAIAINIVNELQQVVTHFWLYDSEIAMLRSAGIHTLKCRFPEVRLYQGKYSLSLYFSERKTSTSLQVLESVCPFEVLMLARQRDYEWRNGLCNYLEEFSWEVS